jgi:hypothetical protein
MRRATLTAFVLRLARPGDDAQRAGLLAALTKRQDGALARFDLPDAQACALIRAQIRAGRRARATGSVPVTAPPSPQKAAG